MGKGRPGPSSAFVADGRLRAYVNAMLDGEISRDQWRANGAAWYRLQGRVGDLPQYIRGLAIAHRHCVVRRVLDVLEAEIIASVEEIEAEYPHELAPPRFESGLLTIEGRSECAA